MNDSAIADSIGIPLSEDETGVYSECETLDGISSG